MKDLEELNALETDEFTAAIAPLFETAPRFVARVAASRPFESEEDLFDTAREIAREMPEAEQIELLDAHPRIGADPAAVSDLSRGEQGDKETSNGWVGDELTALNEAYESHFGFRFVVFVAGRPRVDIIPILERALHAERDEELRRGLDDVVLIAGDRMETLRGPRPLREELREAIAFEISRWMVGEIDRDGLVRETHRLMEEGVDSPALLRLSLANQNEEPDLAAPVARLMSEIGLGGWDREQASQLLALHASASIVGEIVQPIDGARRIASVSNNPPFGELVGRWEAAADQRDAIDAQIKHAAAELFGEED
ncbi:MAG: 2-oxo-4-hydroxy-4-carboxy-5-ureidoimidazoline decarboxylase [Candidatus Limnocylindria bacterium]